MRISFGLLHGRLIARKTFSVGFARRHGSNAATVVDELIWRGFVNATTSPTLREVTHSRTTVYLGVDPSADSLHVGNLIALLALLHFHVRGHQAIALIGGATGMIGDPGGRSTERNLLSESVLEANVTGITLQVKSFLERGAQYASRKNAVMSHTMAPPKVLNNMDWLGKFSLVDFLRVVGKQARVNQMIARDSVKNRLASESGISFTEFTYQLLQAYDFYILHRDHGCMIQIGGSDQWGNIVSGIDLIKRLRGEEPILTATEVAYGLTIPLLTTASGEKFGKSAGNAVWLDGKKTSELDFYQFFFRVADSDVERYLKLFTLLPETAITDLISLHQAKPELRLAQRTLADEVTELVHGPLGLKHAHILTSLLFSQEVSQLDADEVIDAFRDDPRLVTADADNVIGQNIAKLCAEFKLCPSRSAAERLIGASGITLLGTTQGKVVPQQKLTRADLVGGKLAILRAGKDNHLLIHVVG